MKQLKMKFFPTEIKQYPLPEGFRYTNFNGTEEEKKIWCEICRNGLLESDAPDSSFDEAMAPYATACPQKDVFFVENAEGEKLATTTGILTEFGGYIHMVCAKGSARGLGIGKALLAHVMQYLISRGATNIYLTTDDFRLPAIRTYLHLGMSPVLYHDEESDMRARWEAVFEAIGEKYDFISEE